MNKFSIKGEETNGYLIWRNKDDVDVDGKSQGEQYIGFKEGVNS